MRRIKRTKYVPHQNTREMQRRLRQLAKGQLRGHAGFLPDAPAKPEVAQ